MNLPVFLALLSGGALAAAYISQYGFGLDPCILCIYQRIPYAVVLGLSLISLFVEGNKRLALVALCGVTLLVGSAIAFYHVGVENGRFQMSSGCADGSADAQSLEEMAAQIFATQAVPCDQPQFVFLGLSMAGWNMVISSFFGWITLLMSFNMYRSIRAFDVAVTKRKTKDGSDA